MLVVLAFASGLCSSILTAMAYSMNRKAYLQNESLSRSICVNKLWILGTIFLVMGPVISIFPLSVLGQSTSAALSCITIIASILFARLILQEQITRFKFLQLGFIVIGATLMLTFSLKSLKILDYETILALYERPLSTIFLLSYVAIFLLVLSLSCIQVRNTNNRLKSLVQQRLLTPFSHQLPRTWSASTANTDQFVIVESYTRYNNDWIENIPSITLPWFTGYLSAMTTLLIKSTVDNITTAKSLSDAFSHTFAILLLPCVLISAVSQFTLLNFSLKHFKAMCAVPIYESSAILHNVCFGGIIFKDFWQMTNLNLSMFSLGCVFVLSGITFMLCRKPLEKKHKLIIPY